MWVVNLFSFFLWIVTAPALFTEETISSFLFTVKISCAKFLLCSTTWIGPLVSLHWKKGKPLVSLHCISVSTDAMHLWAFLYSLKCWTWLAICVRNTGQSQAILPNVPRLCLCSHHFLQSTSLFVFLSGFWVKVTNHPGLLRTDVSPKQDFKCKKWDSPSSLEWASRPP